MGKEQEYLEALPGYQVLQRKISKYRPAAIEATEHLPDLGKLERQLLSVVHGDEALSLDFVEEINRTRNILEEIRDIFMFGEPPSPVKFDEAVAEASSQVQELWGDRPFSGDTVSVLITARGWEQLNYRWSMSVDIPVEFVDGEKLDEEFTDALDAARDGLTGYVDDTEGTEREECEVTYEVVQDQSDDA